MNNYEMKNNLVKVGENKGRNAILNMYRMPNTVKYYGVVRFNNFKVVTQNPTDAKIFNIIFCVFFLC